MSFKQKAILARDVIKKKLRNIFWHLMLIRWVG